MRGSGADDARGSVLKTGDLQLKITNARVLRMHRCEDFRTTSIKTGLKGSLDVLHLSCERFLKGVG